MWKRESSVYSGHLFSAYLDVLNHVFSGLLFMPISIKTTEDE